MGQNLRARLSRIRTAGKSAAGPEPDRTPVRRNALCPEQDGGGVSLPGWSAAGFKTLKRVLSFELPLPLPPAFPDTLSILVPDFARMGKIPPPEALLFFDLETTGLSGGAGTLAFLTAFGRFAAPSRMEVTQYLLLDYPGEPDFTGSAVKEFSGSPPPVAVSYNGKTFDSQILKTRCLMNGITVPEYPHADLLHPSRRLWKRVLPDCSQATIEESVLGLDRTGDIPGALAPDIWFSFLRTGETRELLAICDHNVRDIKGLSSLFLALAETAAAPAKAARRFRVDGEALALTWNEALKKQPLFSAGPAGKTGELLLETAAGNGSFRAAFALAQSFFKKNRAGEARRLLQKITEDDTIGQVAAWGSRQGSPRAAAFKSLAIDAEWRRGDPGLALEYVHSALAIEGLPESFRNGLEKRRSRLELKTASAAGTAGSGNRKERT